MLIFFAFDYFLLLMIDAGRALPPCRLITLFAFILMPCSLAFRAAATLFSLFTPTRHLRYATYYYCCRRCCFHAAFDISFRRFVAAFAFHDFRRATALMMPLTPFIFSFAAALMLAAALVKRRC